MQFGKNVYREIKPEFPTRQFDGVFIHFSQDFSQMSNDGKKRKTMNHHKIGKLLDYIVKYFRKKKREIKYFSDFDIFPEN